MVVLLYVFSAIIISIIRTMLLKILLLVKYFLMIHLRVHFLPIVLDIKDHLTRIFNLIIRQQKSTNAIQIGKEKICGQQLIKTEIFILFLMKPMDSTTFILL